MRATHEGTPGADQGSTGEYRSVAVAVLPDAETTPTDHEGAIGHESGREQNLVDGAPEPRGYLTPDIVVTRRQRATLDTHLSGIVGAIPAARVLLSHVVQSSTYRVWDADRGVPVYYRLITNLPGAGRTAESVYSPLVDAGLLRVSPYVFTRGQSNTYAVGVDLLTEYVEAGLPEDPASDPVTVGGAVRLLSGSKTKAIKKTRLYDENRNKVGGELWTRAMRSLQRARGQFNAPAVVAHLDGLRKTTERLEAGPGAAVLMAGSQPSGSAQAARFRYLNDARCYAALCLQRPKPTATAGVYSYALAYRHQRSGRAGQIGGGLQSCTRAMKAAAYRGVPGVRNYDMKSSQVNLLIEEFEYASQSSVAVKGGALDIQWLTDYVEQADAKHSFAAAVGVEVGVWKTVLCAVLMGARLPSPAQAAMSNGDVVAVLRAQVPKCASGAGLRDVVGRLTTALGPLYNELKRWHRWLDAYSASHPNLGHGRRRVENLAGEPFDWRPGGAQYARRSSHAAHRLQGREAAFVLNLILALEPSDVRVLSHEHDGLVTVGEIPTSAVDKAKARAGVDRVALVEKPFLG